MNPHPTAAQMAAATRPPGTPKLFWWVSTQISRLRDFYRVKDRVLNAQSIGILLFHLYIAIMHTAGRVSPGTPRVSPSTIELISYYADDNFWIVVHSVVVVLTTIGMLTQKTVIITYGFTLSFFVWLVWGVLYTVWMYYSDVTTYVSGGAIWLVVLPSALATSWAWDQREE